jgi:hypothetical protein
MVCKVASMQYLLDWRRRTLRYTRKYSSAFTW